AQGEVRECTVVAGRRKQTVRLESAEGCLGHPIEGAGARGESRRRQVSERQQVRLKGHHRTAAVSFSEARAQRRNIRAAHHLWVVPDPPELLQQDLEGAVLKDPGGKLTVVARDGTHPQQASPQAAQVEGQQLATLVRRRLPELANEQLPALVRRSFPERDDKELTDQPGRHE